MEKPIMMKPEVFEALKQIQQKNIKDGLSEVVGKNEKAFQEVGISPEDIIDVIAMKNEASNYPDPIFYLMFDSERVAYIDNNFKNPDIKLRGELEREYWSAVISCDSWRIDYEEKTEELSKTVGKALERIAMRQKMLEQEGWGSWEAVKFQVSKVVDKIGTLLWTKSEPMTVNLSEPKEGRKEANEQKEEGGRENISQGVGQRVGREPEKTVDRNVMADTYKLWALTDEQKTASDGVTVLHRIQATKDFGYVFGVDVVKGEMGGWIENEHNLEGNSWVGDQAEVYGRAKVVDSAVIENAIVKEDARVTNDSCIAGNVQITGSACVDNSIIADDARIDGYAVIEKSSVDGYSSVSGESHLHDCTCSVNTHIVNSSIQNVDMSGDIYIEASEYGYGGGEAERDYVDYNCPVLLGNDLLEKLRAHQKNGLKEVVVCSRGEMEFIADLNFVRGRYLTMDLSVSHPVIRNNGKCYDGQNILDKLDALHYPIGDMHPEHLMDMLAGKAIVLGPHICTVRQTGEEFLLEEITEKQQAEVIGEEQQNRVDRVAQPMERYEADARMKSLFAFSGEEKLASDGVTVLHQIQASRDLTFLGEKDIPEGTLGGWIESEKNLSGYSWVDGDAEVFGKAQVINSFILGNSVVRDHAVVKESTVWENSLIEGDAEIEKSLVSGHTRIGGSSVLEQSVFAGYGVINGNSHLDNCFCRNNVNVTDSWLRYVCMEGDFMIRGKQLDCETEGNMMKRFDYHSPELLTGPVLEQLRASPQGLKGVALCEADGKEFVADLNLVAGDDMRMKLVVSNPVVRHNGVNYNSQKVIDGMVKLNRDISGLSPVRLAKMLKGEPLQVRSLLYAIRQKGDRYELSDLRKRVNNIEIYSLKGGGMAIRCMIDGVQQGGKRLSEEAVLAFNDRTDRRALAVDYFMNELRENRDWEHSMRR